MKMMVTSMNTPEILQLVLAVIALGFAAGSLLLLRRQRHLITHLERGVNRRDHHLRHLKQELTALLDCSRGLASQVSRQQEQLRRVDHRQQQLELNETGESHVREAITLGRKGATPEELARTCGLSRAEAHLVLRLHGHD